MKSETSRELPDESVNAPVPFDDAKEARTPDIVAMLNEVDAAREEALEIGLKFEAYLLELVVLALSGQVSAKTT